MVWLLMNVLAVNQICESLSTNEDWSVPWLRKSSEAAAGTAAIWGHWFTSTTAPLASYRSINTVECGWLASQVPLTA